MACAACIASHPNGIYSHCTCYLHLVHGIAPAGAGKMLANDWYNSCTLSDAPSDTTTYLIASSGHVALRKGGTYYYHNGSANSAPKEKPFTTGTPLSWLGISGTVRYKKY